MTALHGLRGCSPSARLLLLAFCVDSKASHLARGLPPDQLAPCLRRFDAAVVDAVAVITGSCAQLWAPDHEGGARAQLALPRKMGGLGLGAQEYNAPSRYFCSLMSCLNRMRSMRIIGQSVSSLESWSSCGIDSPLRWAHRLWFEGLDAAKPFCSLPALAQNKEILDDDGAPSLAKFAALNKPCNALSNARGLRLFDDTIKSPCLNSLAVCRIQSTRGYGSGAWILASPGRRVYFSSRAHFLTSFRLHFGLPMEFITSDMPCVDHCPLFSRRRSATPPSNANALLQHRRGLSSWRLGDHFISCVAGAGADGMRNPIHRHDNVVRSLTNMLNTTLGHSATMRRRDNRTGAEGGECTDIFAIRLSPPDPTQQLVDVTILTSTSQAHMLHSHSAARAGIDEFLRLEGDQKKMDKHEAGARDRDAEFIPFAMDVRGAFGPSAKRYWRSLWGPHIQSAPTRGESKWDAIADQRRWLQTISIQVANDNAEMILSKAGSFWSKVGPERNRFVLDFMNNSANL